MVNPEDRAIPALTDRLSHEFVDAMRKHLYAMDRAGSFIIKWRV
jgi:hypothetical protein